jgi:hypothetical protein
MRRRSAEWLCWTGALVASSLWVGGCHDDHHDDDDGHTDESHHHEDAAVGTSTGSICPTDNTLTYDSFGQEFMDSYCTQCHSSELQGEARNGATVDHDFDTLDGILGVLEHIDQMAAAGPDSVNTTMPPHDDDGDKPTLEEREQLGQWLACELEALEN